MSEDEEWSAIGSHVAPPADGMHIRQPSSPTRSRGSVAEHSDQAPHGPQTPTGAFHVGRKFGRTLSIASTSTAGVDTSMSREQKFTFITFCFTNFCVGAFYSLLGPFFPQEAAKKGVSSTMTGLIFGIFELMFVIMTPVWGNFLTVIGAKFMYVTGVLVAGSCSILFGFLDMCPPGAIYIVMCFLVRCVEALGASAFVTASFAILAFMFPDRVSMMFGTLELFSGLGMMVGPPLGGALYQLGGFKLPFISLGACICLVGIFSWILLPTLSDIGPTSNRSILSLFRIFLVVLVGLVLMGGTAGIGFLDVGLSIFLQDQFHFSPIILGLVFLAGPGAYALTAPIWGWLGDKKPHWSQPLIALGFIGAGVAFVFIGPAPFFKTEQTELWLVLVCLIICGAGIGSLVVCFQVLTVTVRDHGYSDGLETYGLVSGVFNSFFSFGAFLGPLVGGYLIDAVGFPWASFTLGASEAVLGSIFGLYIVFDRCCHRDQIKVRTLPDEASKLLGSDSDSQRLSYS